MTLSIFIAGYPAATTLAGIFLSLAMEQLALPRCPGIRRPLFSAALHGGLLLIAWSAMLLVVRRPVFALLLVLSGQFLIIQINNAKYRALREPFLFSDFGIFSQTIKHPRLYLPFLGLWRAVLIGLTVTAAVGFGWWVEKPLPGFLIWSGGAALVGALLFGGGWMRAAPPTLDPKKDLSRHGLFTSIAQYWLREKTNSSIPYAQLATIRKPDSTLPDIIVIQSESFFDARRLFPGIRHDVLANYDAASAEATVRGRLEVPAWGANTMRSEFAFLSGLDPHTLDVHRFNPYRRVARSLVRALPSVLREAGYATTCIHPHPARFFRRDRAFPNLGFERFIDIKQFTGAKKCGPYVSDEAVTDRLLHELQSADGPSFFFAITMENHGPLHLESVGANEWRDFYTEGPPAGCEELTVYLRHLRNADRQLGRLRERLRINARPSLLLFYGEHLPSMPKVYDALGLPDGRTDYFLQASQARSLGLIDLKVENLAKLVIEDLNK